MAGRPVRADRMRSAKKTENYVGSDLDLIVTEAARYAVTHDRPEIDEANLLRAIEKVTPSLTLSEIEMYSSFANMERW